MKRFISLVLVIVILCPVLLLPAYATTVSSRSHGVTINLPRDGFKQSGINTQILWASYIVPSNGRNSDIKITVYGYKERFDIDSHTITPVDDSGTVVDGAIRLSGLIDFDKETKLTIVVTDYLGNTYSDSVFTTSYSYENKIDEDSNGLDDRVPDPLPPIPIPIANYYGKDIMKSPKKSAAVWRAYDTLTSAEKTQYIYMLLHGGSSTSGLWHDGLSAVFYVSFFDRLPTYASHPVQFYNYFSPLSSGKAFCLSYKTSISDWDIEVNTSSLGDIGSCNDKTCKNSGKSGHRGGEKIGNWYDEDQFHSVRYFIPPSSDKAPDGIISGGGALPPTPTPTPSPTPVPTPPPSGGGEVLPEHYVSINLPRDGFKQSKLNAIALWTHYKVPYNGTVKDIKITQKGFRQDRDIVIESHTGQSIDGGKTYEGFINFSGAVPWNVPTVLTLEIKAHDGTVYNDSITVTCYDDFIDENNDGLDDRTNQDDWEGNPDFGIPPPPSGGGSGGFPDFETTINSISGFTSGFTRLIGTFFTFLPPEFITVLVFGFTCLVVLRIAGR